MPKRLGVRSTPATPLKKKSRIITVRMPSGLRNAIDSFANGEPSRFTRDAIARLQGCDFADDMVLHEFTDELDASCSLKLPEDVIDEADGIAKRLGKEGNRSRVIRAAILYHIMMIENHRETANA